MSDTNISINFPADGYLPDLTKQTIPYVETSVQTSQINQKNGVAGLDASGNITSAITGDASAATVIPTGSPAETSGTKLADIAATANGAVPTDDNGNAAVKTGSGYVLDSNTGGTGGLFPATNGDTIVYSKSRAISLQVDDANSRFIVGTASGSTGSPTFIPWVTDSWSLGVNSHQWANVYSVLATISGIATVGGLQTQSVLTQAQASGSLQIGAPNMVGAITGLRMNNQGNVYVDSFNSGTTTTAGGFFLPGTDNVMNLGGPINRWTQLFAGTSTINTSDITEKTLTTENSDVNINSLVTALQDLPTITYQWNDSITKKGSDKARYHTGYSAQTVQSALISKGIDPEKTALWCNDALTKEVETTDQETGEITHTTQPILDENGKQVYRQGLRIDHLQAILIEANRKRIVELENSYNSLQEKYNDLLIRINSLENK